MKVAGNTEKQPKQVKYMCKGLSEETAGHKEPQAGRGGEGAGRGEVARRQARLFSTWPTPLRGADAPTEAMEAGGCKDTTNHNGLESLKVAQQQ